MTISGINLPLRSEPMEEMEASAEMRCGSLEEQGVPESWEVEDLEKRMKNLSVPSGASGGVSKVGDIPLEEASGSIAMSLPENIGATIKGLNLVDQFLREALQNPRDRLTKFSQLGALQRAQIHTELPPLAVSSYLHGPWVSPPNSMGYFCPDTLMGSFDHGHTRAHSPSAMYLHSTQLAGPSAALSYAHPQEQFLESLAQPHLHEHPDARFGQAWRH